MVRAQVAVQIFFAMLDRKALFSHRNEICTAGYYIRSRVTGFWGIHTLMIGVLTGYPASTTSTLFCRLSEETCYLRSYAPGDRSFHDSSQTQSHVCARVFRFGLINYVSWWNGEETKGSESYDQSFPLASWSVAVLGAEAAQPFQLPPQLCAHVLTFSIPQYHRSLVASET
jgi:hypothetical protein